MGRKPVKVKPEHGIRLKQILAEAKITQKELAAGVYLSKTTISNYANGNDAITLESAQRIVEYIEKQSGIKVRYQWLLAQDDYKTFDDEWDANALAFFDRQRFMRSMCEFVANESGYTIDFDYGGRRVLGDILEPDDISYYCQISNEDGTSIATISNTEYVQLYEDMVEAMKTAFKRGVQRAENNQYKEALVRLYQQIKDKE